MQVIVTLQIELTKNETVHLLSVLTASIRLQEHQWMHAPLRKICFRKIKEIRGRGEKRGTWRKVQTQYRKHFTPAGHI